MAKTTKKKAARKAVPDPELTRVARAKQVAKKIHAGYVEVGRLARRIVAVRAGAELAVRQLANSAKQDNPAAPPADDSLEGSHG